MPFDAPQATVPPVKVLIADSHPVVRMGLTALLCADFPQWDHVVASSGEALLGIVAQGGVNLVLMDFNLPDWDVLALIKEVNRREPTMPVLVFSRQPEDPFAIAAYRAGALGFISQTASCSELSAAIHEVMAGRPAFSPWALDTVVNGSRHQSGGFRELSPRETEFVSLLVEGLSVKDIAARCQVSSSTVNTYRQRILGKIGGQTTTDILRYGWGRGLRCHPPASNHVPCQLYAT